jgi:predicted membrane-bound spermidine synthase
VGSFSFSFSFSLSLSAITGWLAVALLLTAATIPLSYRVSFHRRAAPASRPIGAHAALGLGTAAAALGHAMAILPSLGSPAAITGGTLALAPGAVGFFLLFAHVGVGLKLRAPRLKDREKKRRLHAALATCIVVAVIAHVVALRS